MKLVLKEIAYTPHMINALPSLQICYRCCIKYFHIAAITNLVEHTLQHLHNECSISSDKQTFSSAWTFILGQWRKWIFKPLSADTDGVPVLSLASLAMPTSFSLTVLSWELFQIRLDNLWPVSLPVAAVPLQMIPPRGCAYIVMVHRQDAYRALTSLSRGTVKVNQKPIKVCSLCPNHWSPSTKKKWSLMLKDMIWCFMMLRQTLL